MKHDYILLIVGESGSGKSEVCGYLESTYGLKELKSFTTRPKRNASDKSHTFATDEEFDLLKDIVAYTEYNGYRYAAVSAQVDECDTYIIDPNGVDYFLKQYKGKKIPMVAYIHTPPEVRLRRMMHRGQTVEAARERIKVDRVAFAHVRDYATVQYENIDDAFNDMIEIGEDIYNKFFKEEGDDEYGRKD